MQRRILIVSTMFFPQPNVGAVRITQWCRFLPEFGWTPTVLCRYYGHTATPELLAEKVHPDVTVYYVNPVNPPREPPEDALSATQRSLPWYRRLAERSGAADWVVPDPTVRFWRSVRPKVRRAIQEIEPHVLLTTSPQHSTHDVGLSLSRELEIPWVVDFRDPYCIDARYRPRGLARCRLPAHLRFERAIYQQAALTVHAIPMHGRWARMAYPFARQRVRILVNGFPPELEQSLVEPIRTSARRKSLRVIGWPGDEAAVDLAKAVLILAERNLDLELRFVGRPPTTLSDVKRLLGDRAVATGRLRHDLALRQLAGADVLLCPLDRKRSGHIRLSSKLFEYLAAGKPVVVMNPSRPDRQLVRHLQGVTLLTEPSPQEISAALERALRPDAAAPVEQVEWVRKTFNRRQQVEQLAQWLDELA